MKKGKIEKVIILSRALSHEEIANLYEAAKLDAIKAKRAGR